jgi:putative transposase
VVLRVIRRWESDLRAKLACAHISQQPSLPAAPDDNGCAERFIRTPNSHFLRVQHFATAGALHQALLAFGERYNREWLIGRHGQGSPAAVRAAFVAQVAA